MQTIKTEKSYKDIGYWLRKKKFAHIEFNSKSEYISTSWLNQPVTFKLTEKVGFETWYKEAFGGSLIVFELALENGNMKMMGYCPLLLFGFWPLKLSFKKKAGFIFKYRKQGYNIQKEFQAFLSK
ncbi:MAG: hypothetical protein R8P61_01575 [Bacteroidia bacterium]|nr:hypothetical protein [Bacteroidia bacterium]